jgi:hypothetical protein
MLKSIAADVRDVAEAQIATFEKDLNGRFLVCGGAVSAFLHTVSLMLISYHFSLTTR